MKCHVCNGTGVIDDGTFLPYQCPLCGGSSVIDSGGFSPQGVPISVPCPECAGKKQTIRRQLASTILPGILIHVQVENGLSHETMLWAVRKSLVIADLLIKETT